MARRYYGLTLREHLVEQAALVLQAWHDANQPPNSRDAIDAIAAVVDSGRFGSLGEHMRRYAYRTYEWRFYELAYEIERKSQR